MVIIPAISFKGGVGKSTVALNFAAEVSKYYKVLLVDTDPQNSLAFFLCKDFSKGLSEILFENLDPERAIHKEVNSEPNLDFIPAGTFCLRNQIFYEDNFNLENIKKFLNNETVKNYEFIIFDTPPRISQHIETLIEISNYSLMVLTPDPATFSSFVIFEKFFEDKGYINKILAIVNKTEPSKVEEDFARIFKYKLGEKFLGFTPKDDNVVQSQGKCIPTVFYNPDCAFSIFLKKIVLKFLDLMQI
ncbi:MAG: ParA family protein [Sulfurihydrogenibium sp.]|jgi:cellulose biosynthesis protein BcsQ|nr:ParA family protein [Sulfurihydrogenibium sp.]